jgi:hypothetical protein
VLSVAAGLISLAVLGARWSGTRPFAAALAVPGGVLLIVCAFMVLVDRSGLVERVARQDDEASLWRIPARPLVVRAVGVLMLGLGAAAIAAGVTVVA